MKRLAAWGALVLLPGVLEGQNEQCVFQLDFVGGEGVQIETAGGTNYYAGGGVGLSCRGTKVTIRSDSVAAYGGQIVEFIGKVRYRDTSVTMNADRGTYYKAGERWEARGNVETENLANGSTLTGPSLDYFREVAGIRDAVEMYATGRPIIKYVTTDSTGTPAEPYMIVADRVRMKGQDRVWAGGKVTVDRSDFAARADSLRLDTGAGSEGTLIGSPLLKSVGADSFTLTGRRIDLLLDAKALTFVTAKGDGHAVRADLDLTADTIGLDVERDKLVQTLAWGDSLRPYAFSDDYAVRADSLAVDTPEQRLQEMRAFGRAWVAAKEDSVSGERDWLAGDTVVAEFASHDSSGTSQAKLMRIEARREAQSFYRVEDPKRPGLPGINYSRGDRIVVLMDGKGSGVAQVDVRGQVDGVQLEAAPEATDSLPADSAAVEERT